MATNGVGNKTQNKNSPAIPPSPALGVGVNNTQQNNHPAGKAGGASGEGMKPMGQTDYKMLATSFLEL